MCPETTSEANGYCLKHQAKASGWVSPTRGSSTQRGYGGRWRRLRLQILERDKGLCQICLPEGKVMPAVAVDHIVPKAEGGNDDPENLQAICKRCHKLKTEMESKRARAGGGGQKFRAL
ncbi:DNAse [Marinobacter sp. EN3]|uniref:HNH endonuclease n=1 Tax=Marinobacter sp. EN3 TaxID=1397533 RepID=UPI0003B865D5|nr:HNH endonuclease signature motif containing protein [Marinobacter sp. EN3]ERS12017.1 DNAse [Marinobacter sp. EN3]